ncbi:hypothetical protein HYQ45_012866 [Verticillium longisporum]|uniref:Uncharacterized protein n=1 Tax=Verticillium longisporum TaxID=100787 RepID=A0A8I3ALG0_VERLO|nr:hypothetical protein HYQ45_012866 [Verticillium longisporum]
MERLPLSWTALASVAIGSSEKQGFFVALPIRSDALLNALAEPLLDERSYVSLTGGTVFGGVTFSEYEQSSEWRMPGSRIEKVL